MASIESYSVKTEIVDGDTFVVYSPANGQVVRVPLSTVLTHLSQEFIALSDSPGTYVGQQGKVPQVNNTEDGLVFASSSLAPAFITLPDTPGAYTGATKQLRVNGANNALEFTDSDFKGLTDTPSTYAGDELSLIRVNGSGTGLEYRKATDLIPGAIYVTQASQLAGALSSSIVYFISQSVDMGTTQITVPAGGITFSGYSFETSKLVSSAPNYIMFISPAGGSGEIQFSRIAIEVTGAASQVYDITASTGNEAFELIRVNYNGCTSCGEISGYRQGLESGTGRYGGSPSLILSGNWAGGYRITTAIIRGLSAGMTGSVFEAGTGFLMNSRFLTDINCDLPVSASFADFTQANFFNSSTFQIQGAIFTRNGAIDAGDANIIPNMNKDELAAIWKNNIGLTGTYVGGEVEIGTEILTSIVTLGVPVDVNGAYSASLLEHFDNPSLGQLRHLGDEPRDYNVTINISVTGTAGNDLALHITKWDNSLAVFTTVKIQRRQVNSFTGGRDVAFFDMFTAVTLDRNDYIKMQIANNTSTADVSVEVDSFMRVTER